MTRRGVPVLLGALLASLFLMLATDRLDRPGLYHDEVLFVPATLAWIEDCRIDAPVSLAPGCAPLMLEPPYLGGLKALLHAPVFALFGVDAASVRLPSILVACASLLLAFGWLQRQAGTALAASAGLVLAIDPAFVAHARIDWGPFALATLLKLALLASVLRWLGRGEPRMLVLCAVLAASGLWDKLSFAWIVVAFGLAALATQPRAVVQHLASLPRAGRALLVAGIALGIVAAGYLAIRATRLDIPAGTGGIAARTLHLWQLYSHTFSGTSVLAWITATPRESTLLFNVLALVQTAASSVLLAATRSPRPRDAGARDALAFVTVAIVVLWFELGATPQVGGSHHLMALWPLPVLQAALLFACARDALRARGRMRAATACVAAGIALALLLGGRHAGVDREYLHAWRDDRWAATFDPAIVELSRAVERAPVELVVSVDWGLHPPLVALAPPAHRARYRDAWATIARPPDEVARRLKDLRARELADRTVAFVGHVPNATVKAATLEHFPAWLAHWNACPRSRELVAGSDGKPLYEITVVSFGLACDPVAARR